MLQLDSNLKQTIYIDWVLFLPTTNWFRKIHHHQSTDVSTAGLQSSSGQTSMQVQAKTEINHLQLAYQLLSRRDALTESIVQTESRRSLMESIARSSVIYANCCNMSLPVQESYYIYACSTVLCTWG